MFGRKRELINSILTKAEEIRDAANRDNEKWGENFFDSEIEMIIEWVKVRYDYFENIYGRGEKSTGVV